MKAWFGKAWIYVVAIVAIGGLLALTIAITGRKNATNGENALWTFILFAIGAGVSFYTGRKSVKDAANDLVKPFAKGAARRLITLGRGVGSVQAMMDRSLIAARQVASANAGQVPLGHIELTCDLIRTQIDGQLVATIVDALEDWREFEPTIVNQLVDEESATPPKPPAPHGGNIKTA